jgi:site-specific recombinase
MWLKKIKSYLWFRKDLDQILSNVPDLSAPLRERTHWFFDLLDWIRFQGPQNPSSLDFKTGTAQALRLKHLLNVLDRQPDWKISVARNIHSVLNETSAFQLFVQTGLSVQDSFFAEFLDRLQRKLLPTPPDESDLTYLFQQNFSHQQDLQWVQQIDTVTFKRLQDLIDLGSSESKLTHWQFKEEAERAILLLAVQVQALGLSPQLRMRSRHLDFRKSSFYIFGRFLNDLFSENEGDLKLVLEAQFQNKIQHCYRDLSDIKHQLTEYGVSVQIVFLIEKLESLLRRIENLMLVARGGTVDPAILASFLEILVAESLDKNSLTSLIGESFSLLARKIVERTGETGENYITRDSGQQRDMLRRAIGGGVLTSLTTIVKFGTSFLGLSAFFNGITSGLNYAGSFLCIHFLNFTLATKQSSMTAPALAQKLHHIEDSQAFEKAISEIINLLRTQMTAVLGNVMGVIPITMALCWIFHLVAGHPFLPQEKAIRVFQDFSILGPTPIFAAFTGVLLWISSLIAGWFDNWFAYHRMGQALSENRRLVFILGAVRARFIATFLKRHMAGITGSISLGFLLGLSPALLQFFGIGLDVRHVTLSSGALAAAGVSLRESPIEVIYWISAILGILSMALLNISVSFALAFLVAVRARKIQAPQRNLIYRAVWKKIIQKPLILIFAETKGESSASADH